MVVSYGGRQQRYSVTHRSLSDLGGTGFTQLGLFRTTTRSAALQNRRLIYSLERAVVICDIAGVSADDPSRPKHSMDLPSSPGLQKSA